jgi:nitrite reductase/ring-hydroxylating ferredoxin subunit
MAGMIPLDAGNMAAVLEQADEVSGRSTGWVRVAALDDVPPGSLKAVRADKQHYALANIGGNLYALLNECPHRGGPLAGGRLIGTDIACGWHGFRFDARTGEATMPTDHDPAAGVAVRIVDGHIELAVGRKPS